VIVLAYTGHLNIIAMNTILTPFKAANLEGGNPLFETPPPPEKETLQRKKVGYMSEETVYWCLIGNDEVGIYGIV